MHSMKASVQSSECTCTWILQYTNTQQTFPRNFPFLYVLLVSGSTIVSGNGTVDFTDELAILINIYLKETKIVTILYL